MKTRHIFLFLLVGILLFFLPVLSYSKCTLILGNPPASVCSTATDEVGDRTEYANTNGIIEGEIDCILYVAECTGTLEYAFIRHAGTETDNCKVGVCNYDGDAPDDGDNECVWSSGDTVGDDVSEDDAWVQLSGKLGKSVVKDSSYWVCVLGGSGGCPIRYKGSSGSQTLYYEGGFTYASPPSNLTSPTPPWAVAGYRNMSVYVRIE